MKMVLSGDKFKEVSFPIGGIGTGTVSLSGRGALIDWEIFNRPNKGSVLPFSFFTLWVKEKDSQPITRLVQSSYIGPYNIKGDGAPRYTGAGLPHLDSCTFKGEYPFAWIEFKDMSIPVKIVLEAYNPFIPLNDMDSGIPVANFRFNIVNESKSEVYVTLAANLFNPIGYPGTGPFEGPWLGKNVNSIIKENGLVSLHLSSRKYSKDDPRYGSMALATPWKNVTYQTHWFRGHWFDSMQSFWDEFSTSGSFKERSYGPSDEGKSDIGSIGLKARLKHGESVTLPIYICWYFPNFEKYWDSNKGDCCSSESRKTVWKNYYSLLFRDALDVARYVSCNEERLYRETRLFHSTLFESTLPDYVIDAISSQMSIIRTPTCIRLEDGTFYGFEGCLPQSGCCEGSCTHVWNYAQSLAFLFPALERSMREADYKYNQFKDGKMCFRLQLPLGNKKSDFHPAADGQMGGILKVYRDWKLCGDDAWLRRLWPKVKKALEYAWVQWDKDKDGVMEGIQHNTYDIEFIGPNTMMGSFYLGALRAAEEMARYLGEKDKAKEYHSVFEKGKKKMDELLFNGEYYVQRYNPRKVQKYQYGEGCLSDQLIGQWFSHLVGLGYILNKENVRTALKFIFRYNWKTNLKDHANCQRIYALNDEKGLLLCSWPKGGRPVLPFVYSDEVWCGVEYQVASHLIYEGYLREGLSIVKGVRNRHNGEKRNPWNEFECGNHYARSMSSWSLLTALSGFSFDMTRGRLGFSPQIFKENFRTFWSVDSGWGNYSQNLSNSRAEFTLEVRYGRLKIKEIELPVCRVRKVSVRLGTKHLPLSIIDSGEKICVQLNEMISLKAGEQIRYTYFLSQLWKSRRCNS